MTKEETKEFIKVMQDYVDGKGIEYINRNSGIKGNAYTPSWNWSEYNFTTKNDSKLRAWHWREVPPYALLKVGDCIVTIMGVTMCPIIGKWKIEVSIPKNNIFAKKDFYLNDLVTSNLKPLHSVDGGVTWLPCGVME